MRSSLRCCFLALLASLPAALTAAACSTGEPSEPRSPAAASDAALEAPPPAGDAATGTPDADAAGDAASGSDAGDASALCASPTYAGCTMYEDRTAPGAARTVTFTDFEYTPKCIRIKAGQSVTFEGDFEHHPLLTACGPTLEVDKRAGTTASFTLSAAGLYGYYCLDHGNPIGQVMSGAIDVTP